MNIGIANDHRGFKLKQNVTNFLKSIGYNIIDYFYVRRNYYA